MESTTDASDNAQHKLRRIIIGLQLWVALPIGLIFLALLWVGWVYGKWDDAAFYAIGFLIWGTFSVVGKIWQSLRDRNVAKPQRPKPNFEMIGSALEAAIEDPNDETLPPLTIQPEILTDVSGYRQRTRLPSLGVVIHHPSSSRSVFALGFVAIIGCMLLFALPHIQDIALIIIKGQTLTHEQYRQQIDAYFQVLGYAQWVLLIPFILTFSGLFLPLLSSLNTKLWADQTALWWRQDRRWHQMDWSAMRAIVRIDMPIAKANDPTKTMYVISTGTQLLGWVSQGPQHRREPTPSETLLRLAVTQTGLPVRDGALLMRALDAQASAGTQVIARDGSAIERRAQALLVSHSPEKPLSRSPLWAMLPIGTICLFLPFISYHVLYDEMRLSYLASLPSQIHSITPIYQSTLLLPDDHWNNAATAYSREGYVLRSNGDGQSLTYSLMRDSYGAVAIETSVTTQSAAISGATDGVGLIVRYDAHAYDGRCGYMTFTINEQGIWHFDTCSIFTTKAGKSGAIHTGLGATNTLLVIARANQYFLYINGQFMDQIYDEYPEGGTISRIGLVNLGGSVTGIFRDFSVWPVKSPPDWSYV